MDKVKEIGLKVYLFCIFLFTIINRYMIICGSVKMFFKVVLNISIVVLLIKVLICGIKVYKGIIDRIILISFCMIFIGIFCIKTFPCLLDFVTNNKVEVVTDNYDFYMYGSVHKKGYYLKLDDIGKFRITRSLYHKFKEYDGKIKVVYWGKSEFVASVEYIIED